MADKNKDENVCDTKPHDLKDHFEFAHAIVVAMGNNCPTAEWSSWEDVPGNVKKAVMNELLCKYTLDDNTNEQLMDGVLDGGYNRWRYEVLRNGLGPSK
ncbi:hypothetical protein D8674_019297 [Pyrus ussuriensis x Pyrus communis]|uniref:Uncharacterized protein n=1 Tax=Pyrus ussuriensis x Pyrus communis TaxID=2448454 RepID=A0A5N5G767_9ROSA|nr:hypothetical protein D8674_019297 [Pyrus ussuriensis x Pyrus communis]